MNNLQCVRVPGGWLSNDFQSRSLSRVGTAVDGRHSLGERLKSINNILMGYILLYAVFCMNVHRRLYDTFMFTKIDSLFPLIESKLEYPARPKV